MSHHHTVKCVSSSTGSVATRSSKRKLNTTDVKQTNDQEQIRAPSQPTRTRGRKKPEQKTETSTPSLTPKCTQRNREVRGRILFSELSADVLEHVARYLDTKSAVALLRTCKTVHEKLVMNGSFWKHLCRNENFHEYAALKTEDPDCEETSSDAEESHPEPAKSRKIESRQRTSKYYTTQKNRNQRLSWSCDPFHEVIIPKHAKFWRKIFLRGIQMRRNICQGRFELWRLFLTDNESCPVKKMSKTTTDRELRSSHRRSTFNQPNRRVKINRYWNEDYLIAIQHSPENAFCDVFVWGWKECQNPKFLYSHSFQEDYPTGLYPTAFFLWKKYLVLMPEVDCSRDERMVRSMIRVHDMSSGMKLVGQYDFPIESGRKRVIKAKSDFGLCHDVAHLHKIQNKAVALCRAPNFSLFIFSLPDCNFIQEIPLISNPEFPLENDVLDQRFIIRDNTLIFLFHDKDFFGTLMTLDDEAAPDQTPKFGRVLFVDLDKFLVDKKQSVEIRIDNKFDTNEDFIEKVSVINKHCFALALNSGKVVLRDIIMTPSEGCTHVDRLVIPCPENLKDDFDSDLGDEVDTDGPNVVTSRDGDRILVMRHFESGRRIDAYDVRNNGKLLYQIDLDHFSVGLCREPGYISIDMDGCFVCAADLNQIVIWNSKTGQYINTIKIPSHYNVRNDNQEPQDAYSWKGHTDFAFAEDGIIIVHSKRNFPIAADVMLFW